MSQVLKGKVALVAGATRGAGRGIAVELGAAGATVYCAGRTTRTQHSEYNRPETIEETAELVQHAGGQGIAVQVDHLDPAQVQALVARIEREQSRLDILVNDVWGADFLIEWNVPVWEHSLEGGLRMLRLAIDTHMREDSIRLYGFATEHERAWFRALQTVQGVGAKVALAVLGTLDAADLANAVALQDKNMVARAPGVGPKVAARIVAELKDKMPSLAPAIRPGGGVAPITIVPEGASARDAVSALTNLGYGHAQAAAAVSLAVGKAGREARTEELIRLGLRELAQ